MLDLFSSLAKLVIGRQPKTAPGSLGYDLGPVILLTTIVFTFVLSIMAFVILAKIVT